MFTRRPATMLFSAALFIVCAAYVVTQFQWRAIFVALARLDLLWLLAGGTLSIIGYWLLRTLRWSIMLKRANIAVPFAQLYLCGASSMGIAHMTPFQSGEMLKVEMLKKYGHVERLPGYASFLVERVIDLFVVALLALLSVLFHWRALLGLHPMLAVALALILLGCATAGWIAFRLELQGKLGMFLRQLRAFGGATLARVALLTVCAWFMVALGWQICLWSLPIKIGFLDALALTAVMTMVNVLSMIPGALGISEAGIAQILLYLGNTPVAAQAGAIVLRCFGLLIIGLGLVHLLVWKLRAKHAAGGRVANAVE